MDLRLKKYIEEHSASFEDMQLDELISEDIATIWEEVGGQDGMYDSFPITRFYRGETNIPYRAYALDSGGGIAIIAYINKKNRHWDRYKIVTLGEDDGYFFLNGSDLYCDIFEEKSSFLFLLSESISLINNNI